LPNANTFRHVAVTIVTAITRLRALVKHRNSINYLRQITVLEKSDFAIM